MLRRSVSFLILSYAAASGAVPFWKSKDKIYARVKDGEVIVAVRTEPHGGKRRLTVGGGGWVKAPVDQTFAFARDFERVSKLSGYVERASYDRKAQRMNVSFAALGHRAEFDVKIEEVASDPERALIVEVLSGPLRGLRASLNFAAADPKRTEVGFDGSYDYDTFPLAGFFLSRGFEIVFKAMATRLRTAVESASAVDNAAGRVKESRP